MLKLAVFLCFLAGPALWPLGALLMLGCALQAGRKPSGSAWDSPAEG